MINLPALVLGDQGSPKPVMVDPLRRYSNRSDLLEQLHKVTVSLSRDDETAVAKPPGSEEVGGSRSRWLRHRFTTEEQQTMIDLYRSGASAREVGERYGIGERAIKRLLQAHGVRRTAEHGSRRLRDRFSDEELRAMVELYRSGVPAREVAEKYNVNLRTFKRLIQASPVLSQPR